MRLVNKRYLENKRFIFFGDEIEESRFYQIGNGFLHNKPCGGLWCCVENRVGHISEWSEWCDAVNFTMADLTRYNRFKISPEAKILLIDNREDLDILLDKYGSEDGYYFKKWDFEKMSDEYDGVLLTRKGYYENYMRISSWDIPSMVIFRYDIIYDNEFFSEYRYREENMSREIEKIEVHYSDGEVLDRHKSLLINIVDISATGEIVINAEMCNLSDKDLVSLGAALKELGKELSNIDKL